MIRGSVCSARAVGLAMVLQSGVEPGGLLLETLRLRTLPFGLSQALLSVSFAVCRAQFRLGTLTPGAGSLLVGRSLPRLRLRRTLLGFPELFSRLQLLTLRGSATQVRQHHQSKNRR